MSTKNYEYDYYNILNVAFNATPEEIKTSYRKLAKIYHPDIGGSEYEFKKILIAYETLIDEHERKMYDEWYMETYMTHTQQNSSVVTVKVFNCFEHSSHEEMLQKPNPEQYPPIVYTDEEGYYYAISNINGITDDEIFFCQPNEWFKIIHSFTYKKQKKFCVSKILKVAIWVIVILEIVALFIIIDNKSQTTDKNQVTYSTQLDSELVAQTPPQHRDITRSLELMMSENNNKETSPLEIKLPKAGSDYYYIKIIDAYTNKYILSVFMHPNTNIKIYVPLGIYKIKYACGTTWYGYENLFGHTGCYAICEDIFEFKESEGWTITLYPVTNGNMETENISFEEF